MTFKACPVCRRHCEAENAVEALEDALKELEKFHRSGFFIHRHSAQRLADTMMRLEKICISFIDRVRDDL